MNEGINDEIIKLGGFLYIHILLCEENIVKYRRHLTISPSSNPQ